MPMARNYRSRLATMTEHSALSFGDIRDTSGYVVTDTTQRYAGPIFTLQTQQIAFPDGSIAGRDVVRHGGAVAIVALDDQQRVVLISQYRPAVAQFLWELPAGLLDKPGEDPVAAAARELSEEVSLQATSWHTLVDTVSAPGFCDERVRVYLATGLSAVADSSFVRQAEEADLVVCPMPLDACVEAVFDGTITNCITSSGILATDRYLRLGGQLRPADTPWPA